MGRPTRLLVLPALAGAIALGYFLPHSSSSRTVIETAAAATTDPPSSGAHWIPFQDRGPKPTTTTLAPPPTSKPPPSTTLPRPAQTLPEPPRQPSTPSTTVIAAPASTAPSAASGGSLASDFACIARYESSDSNDDTGNGFYGYFQIEESTWAAYGGGPGTPNDYSYGQQLAVAERILAGSGWGAWPNTSRMCGL